MSELPPHEARRICGWQLGRVAEAVSGEVSVSGGAEATIRGVSTDTRSIDDGELFVALRGENFDGHEFVEEAAGGGARGAVVASGYERPDDLAYAFPLIRVDETREALGDLGHAVWQAATDDGLHTVDVTGSNGKTTTKEMLEAIWSTYGRVYATPGNFNNEVGLPLTLCALPDDTDHLILEMGANGPGEISELIRRAPGTERIITSIGYAHTEGFGSIDGIREAKSELFEAADSETLAIVPHEEADRLPMGAFDGRRRTFGRDEEADLQLLDYRMRADERGIFEAVYDGSAYGPGPERFSVEVGLPGTHNGLNLAAALTTVLGREMALEPEKLSRKLALLDLPAGRWRTTRHGDLAFVDDAYNANPSSVRASFEAFLTTDPPADLGGDRPPRRLAVLGEMHELGPEARQWHETVAGELAAHSDLDGFCAVGEFAEPMVDAVETAGHRRLEAVACETPEAAAQWLVDRKPAHVWMKASRANGLERVIDEVSEVRDDE